MTVTQSGQSFQLIWELDTPQEVTITRNLPTPVTELATLPSGTTSYVDVIEGVVEGDSCEWEVMGNVTFDSVTLSATADDPSDDPWTYGEPDPELTEIRYTTLSAVKSRLGVTGTAYDTALTQTIIATEIQMDLHLGRSFPDEGTNPQYLTVPVPVKEAATNAAIAVWKMGDAPTGTIDSEFLGPVDPSSAARRHFQNNPLTFGMTVSWGVV